MQSPFLEHLYLCVCYVWQAIGTFFMDIVNSSHCYATGGTSVSEGWYWHKGTFCIEKKNILNVYIYFNSFLFLFLFSFLPFPLVGDFHLGSCKYVLLMNSIMATHVQVWPKTSSYYSRIRERRILHYSQYAQGLSACFSPWYDSLLCLDKVNILLIRK